MLPCGLYAAGLALSVLALLLHVDGPTYIIGVLEGTLMTAIVFYLWRRFAFVPLDLRRVMRTYVRSSGCTPGAAASAT